MPVDKLTIEQFAQKVKAKYPEYKDVNDSVLVEKMVAKYPEYKDKISYSASPSQSQQFKPMTDWLSIPQGFQPMVPGNSVQVVDGHEEKVAKSKQRISDHISDIDKSVHDLIYNKKKDLQGRIVSEQLGLNPKEIGPVNTQAQQLEAKLRQDIPVTPQEIEGFKSDMGSNQVMTRQALNQKAVNLSKTDPLAAKQLKSDIYRLDRQNDPAKESKVDENIDKIKDGEYDYDIVSGQLVIPQGFFGSLVTGFKEKVQAFDDAGIYESGDKKATLSRVKERLKHDPDKAMPVPEKGWLGVAEMGRIMGGQPLKPLIGGGAAGLLLGPEAGAAASSLISVPEMYRLTLGSALPHNYEAVKKQEPNLSDDEALDKALELTHKQAAVDAASGAAMGALGAKVGFSPTGLKAGLLQKSLGSALKQIGQEGVKKAIEGLGVGSIGAAGQYVKNIMAQKAGIPTDSSEGMAQQLWGGVQMTMAMTLIAKAPELLKPKTYTELLQSIKDVPKDQVEAHLSELEQSGQITPDQSQSAQKTIEEHQAIDNSIKPNVPESDRLTVHELIKKRNELEASLETEDKAYHAETKEEIKKLNERINAVSKGEERGELQKLVDDEYKSGNLKGYSGEFLRNSSESVIKRMLSDIADQAHDPNTAEHTIETFGQAIVDKAKELYPKEVPADSGVSVVLPGDIKRPETITIAPRELPKDIKSTDKVSVIMPKSKENAIPVESSNEISVGETSGDSQPMGEGVSQPGEVAGTQETGGAQESAPAGQEGIGEPPAGVSGSGVHSERPAGQLSFRGLQDTANEFGFEDVRSRDPKTDLQTKRNAEIKVNEWAAKGEYQKNIDDLLGKVERREMVPTDEQRLILEEYIENEKQKARDIVDKSSEEYNRQLAKVQRIKEIGNTARSEAAAALRIPDGGSRVHPINDEVDAMVAKMEANKVDQLTDQQKAEVEAQVGKYKKASDEANSKVAELEDRVAKMEAQKGLNKIKAEVKSSGKSQKSNRVKIIEDIKKKWHDEKLDSIAGDEVNNAASENTVDEYLRKANGVLKKLFPDVEVKAYDTAEEYRRIEQRPVGSRGVYDALEKRVAFNMEDIRKANSGKTIFHEIIHPIINEVIAKNDNVLSDLYTRLYELKDYPGMDQVWAHENNYRDRPLSIRKVESITEFMALVADGKIDTSALGKSAIAKFVELVNKILEKIGSKIKISAPDDLKTLADSIKAALSQEDTEQLEGVLANRRSGAMSEAMDSLSGSSNRMTKIAPYVKELVKDFVINGVEDLDSVVKAVHNELKNDIPELTERNIHDIIAGEYNEKPKPLSELRRQLNDIRDEAKYINQYEALRNGKEPKSEKDKRERNQKIKEIKDKIKSLRQDIKDSEKFYGESDAPERKLDELRDELERIQDRRQKEKPVKDSQADKEISAREQELRDKIKDAQAEWDKEIESGRQRDRDYAKMESERNRQMQRVSDLKDKLGRLQKGDNTKGKSPAKKVDTPEIEALKKQVSDAEKELNKTIATEKRVKGLEEELDRLKQRKEKEPKEENKREISDKEAELRKQVDEERKAFNKEKAEAEKFYGEELDDDAKKLIAIKKRNQKLEQQIKEKIANGQFEKEAKTSIFDREDIKKNYPRLRKDALDAISKKEEAQHEFDLALFKDEMSKRNFWQKAAGLGGKLIHTSKAVMSGIDDSATFVQNGLAMMANPKTGAKVWLNHWKDAFSDARFKREIAALHQRPDWEIIQKSGLDVVEPHSAASKQVEEAFEQNLLAGKIKIGGKEYQPWKNTGGIFERAFTSMGNNFRVALFEKRMKMLLDEGKTFESHPKEFKDAARAVNDLTGRGKLPLSVAQASPWLTPIIWAPRLLASTLNTLGLSDLGFSLIGKGEKGYYRSLTPTQRKFALSQLGKGVAMGVGVMGAASLAGAKVDYDPRSVTFGDIIVGDHHFNVFGRYVPVIKTIVQFAYGVRMKNGVPQDLDSGKFGAKTRAGVVGGFFRGKTTPSAGVAYDLAVGKNYYTGEPMTVRDLPESLLQPMSVKELRDGWDHDGTATILNRFLPAFEGIKTSDERDFEKKSGSSSGASSHKKSGHKKTHISHKHN